jgi:uncharacterized protein (DUF433 family)
MRKARINPERRQFFESAEPRIYVRGFFYGCAFSIAAPTRLVTICCAADMDNSPSYVSIDQNGVLRVAGSRVSIDSIVVAFQNGESAEEIQRNFPSVSLEQVYGTIAHYLAHREEIETYLAEQRGHWDQSRKQAAENPNPAVRRLQKMRANKTERVG